MPKKNRKRYFAKVYDKGGTFITILSKISPPFFPMQINGGLGQLQFAIPRKFDDFDENYVIASRNIVEIYCVDGDTGSDGRLIYSGYIPDYSPSISGSQETVTILLYGFGSETAQVPLKEGDYLTLKTDTVDTLTFKLDDPDQVEVTDVVKRIIDIYQQEKAAFKVTYDADSIPDDTGNVIAYSFVAEIVNDALSKTMEFAPENWYYFVGADNKFQFKAAPTVATHTFVLERDFGEVIVDKTIQNLVNKVMFTNGDTEPSIIKFYEDAASVAEFGEYWGKIDDSSVNDIAIADLAAQNYLDANSQPKIRTKVRIFDNNNRRGRGQDIENIFPGDTCKFRGFNDITSQTFNENMLIVKVDYTPSYVDLELEELQPNISRDVLALIKRTISANNTSNANLVASDDPQPLWKQIGATGQPAFLHSWVNFGGSHYDAAYMKDALGFVHLRGSIKSGTVPSSAFVLPAGYRPLKDMDFLHISASSTLSDVYVSADGSVNIGSGNNGFINLNQVYFYAEG